MSSDKGNNEKKPRSKKKGKNKKKQNNSPQEKSFDSSPSARKPRYPCLICNDEHFTPNYPHNSEFSKLLKTSNTSTKLTNPFPKPKTNMVATDHASTSQVLFLSTSKPKIEVLVSTRSKDYGNQLLSSNNQADQPKSSTSNLIDPIPPHIAPKLTIKPRKGVVYKSKFNPQS